MLYSQEDHLLPPHSLDAEESVLGAMMIDPNAMGSVVNILEPADFFRDSHRWLYACLSELYQEGVPPDFLTIMEKLRVQGKWEDIGGEGFLIDVINAVPTAMNLTYYADIVREYADKRRIIEIARCAVNEVWHQSIGSSEAAQRMIERLVEVARNETQKIKTLQETGEEAFLGQEQKVATGFYALDTVLEGGIALTDLVIVAGRPGMGKTAFMLQTALKLAKRGQKVAFFSLEMSPVQLYFRLLSAECEINMGRIRKQELSVEEKMQVEEKRQELDRLALFLLDRSSGQTPGNVVRTCQEMAIRWGKLDFVFIDYIQQMAGDGKHGNNRTLEIAEISWSLKTLASQGTRVVVGSQLSREVEKRQDKRPSLCDLRDSGSLEQDADIVLGLYRDDYYTTQSQTPGITELIVLKQRNGPTGTASLSWTKEFATFGKYTIKEVDLSKL